MSKAKQSLLLLYKKTALLQDVLIKHNALIGELQKYDLAGKGLLCGQSHIPLYMLK
jgi:hypothetical protein